MNPETNRRSYALEETDGDTILESPRDSTFKGEMNATIPETHEARTLVLCFDGTGDKFDDDNTNVVEFFGMLKKGDHQKQMVYYQAGIGTYISRKALPMGTKISQILDEAVAWDLSSHIIEGYEYLMEHYQPGDSICIFGFSRGAYTAGGLASMICKVGLLPKSNRQQVRFAYNTFISDRKGKSKRSQYFKDTFSTNVKIRFIGVWDTVDSVGLIPQRVPFNTNCDGIQTFRHALALDERRVKFKATPWTMDKSQNFGERTDAEQVWFAGCHCDVGGGSVENGKPHSLARIPLRWMIRECFKTKTGIMFESEKLRATGIDPSTLYPGVQERPSRLAGLNRCIEHSPSTGERWKGRMEKKKEVKREEKERKAEDRQKQKGEKKDHAKDEGTRNGTTNTEMDGEHESFKTDIGLPARRVGAQSLDPKTEEEHELLDALSPIYDQLWLRPFWWLLEIFPLKRHKRKNKEFGADIFRYRWNFGEGRYITPQKKVKVHRSVQTRREAQYADGKEYLPKAPIDESRMIIWVD